MAEHVGTTQLDTNEWLATAKANIKIAKQSLGIQRIKDLKHVVAKSVNDTLIELKLKKYDGSITYFNLSSDEAIEKLNNEWNVLKLDEWKGPNIDDEEIKSLQFNDYLSKCTKQYDDEYEKQCDLFLNAIFWEFVLNQTWIYCKAIASEIFGHSSDVQLLNTLHKCLSVCAFLDVLKAKKLTKQIFINNINLQNIVNQQFGTKLDVEKWKKTEDIKKVYKHCAVAIQKEAMKAGKEFTKLHKVYKIQRRKEEKKRKSKEAEKKQNEEAAAKAVVKQEKQQQIKKEEEKKPEKEKEKEKEKKEEIQHEIKTETKAEIKTEIERKEQSSNNNTYLFALAIVIALCLIILAVTKWN